MREALLGQKKGMGGGLFVRNSGFTYDTLRALPPPPGVLTPGILVLSCFVKADKKSYISPRTFNLRDPVWDYVDGVQSKDAKKQLENVVNFSKEYWMAVILRSDPGDAKRPNIRIFQTKPVIYTAIIDRIIDEQLGENVTDFYSGRDYAVKKSVVNGKTNWAITAWGDATPVGAHKRGLPEDKGYTKAVIAAAKSFVLSDHVSSPDWDLIESAYTAVTGDPVPEEYTSQPGWREELKLGDSVEEAELPAEPVYAEGEEPPVLEDAGTEDGVVAVLYNVGDRVTFTDDDNAEQTGVVTGEGTVGDEGPDKGRVYYTVKIDGAEDDVGVFGESLSLVEDVVAEGEPETPSEDEPEAEPEPMPVKAPTRPAPRTQAPRAVTRPGAPTAGTKAPAGKTPPAAATRPAATARPSVTAPAATSKAPPGKKPATAAGKPTPGKASAAIQSRVAASRSRK